MRPRKGFTLIEILVVVGIIALIISILLPSLKVARAQPRRVVCMSNLRHIGVANEMYLESNRDYFPDARGKDWSTVTDDRFDGKAFYGKALGGQFGVLVCPSDPLAKEADRVSYVVNEYTFQWAQEWGYTDPLRRDKRIWRPERVVFVREWWDHQNRIDDWPHLSGFWGDCLDVHNNGANYLFMDAHVAHYKKVKDPPDLPGEKPSTWYEHGITMVPYELPKRSELK